MSRVIALVTLYNPEPGCFDNIDLISKQVSFTFVCDNSPQKSENDLLKKDNIKYLWFGKNLGLSAAFNSALKSTDFEFEDDDFIVFFDQDSKIEDGHIQKLLDEFINLRNLKINVGLIGPVYFNLNTNSMCVPKKVKWINDNSFEVPNIITSSMISKFGYLKTIDFWNEDVFLDLADWDICWRMQSKGFKCIETKVTTLKHSLGQGEKKIGFIKLRVGAPFRGYYQTREAHYLLKKDYVPFRMRIKLLKILTIRNFLHSIFLDNAKERKMYFKMGKADFKNQIHGELKINR